MKKVTEWLCVWLETNLWGFNSLLSRASLLVLVQKQALQMCGKGEGSREVTQRSLRLVPLASLLVWLQRLLR